jgi:hypothetical protein
MSHNKEEFPDEILINFQDNFPHKITMSSSEVVELSKFLKRQGVNVKLPSEEIEESHNFKTLYSIQIEPCSNKQIVEIIGQYLKAYDMTYQIADFRDEDGEGDYRFTITNRSLRKNG